MANSIANVPDLAGISSSLDDIAQKCHEQADQGLYDPTTFEWKYHDLPALPPDLSADGIVPDFHPDDTALTNRQLALAWFHREFGVIGVWTYLHQIATEEKAAESKNNNTPNESWATIINDYKKGLSSRVLYYLSAMHPLLIQALIDGDLPSRMQDQAFLKEVGSLTPGNVQGVYIIYVALKAKPSPINTPHDPDLNKWTGRNLTLAQLICAVDNVKRYVRLDSNDKRTQSDVKFCKTIDDQFAVSTKNTKYMYTNGESRYVKAANCHQILEWAERLDGLFLDDARDLLAANPQDPILSIPLRRTFPYVGLAAFPSTRSSQHHSHQGSESPLYGVFTAIIKHLYTWDFGVTDFTYEILRTVRQEDVGLTEILCTILSSGYTGECGLCANHAGKQQGKATSADGSLSSTYKDDLVASAEAIRASKVQEHNLTESARKIEQWSEFPRDMTLVHRGRSNLEATIHSNISRTKTLQERLASVKLQSQIDDLQGAWDELKVSKSSHDPTSS